MFQYAFCRLLQEKFGQEICFDISMGTEFASTNGDGQKESVLSEFSIDTKKIQFIENKNEFDKAAGEKIKVADFLCYMPRGIRKIFKRNDIYRKLVSGIQNRFNKYGFYTAYDCYYKPYFNLNCQNLYINGLFTSRKYFDEIHDLLVKEFCPSHEQDKRNMAFAESISQSVSVCMHVRKGKSYLSNSYLNICTGSYYEEAMNIIEERVKCPKFYIFSNDFEWCKANINFEEHSCVLVDANDSQHAVDELMLMSKCKHFILSNSTMGWWAQYLSDSKEKIVVSPDVWTQGKIELLSDLIEEKWIKVKVCNG